MKKPNTNLIEELMEILCIRHYAQKIHEIEAKQYIYNYLTSYYNNPQLYKTYLNELKQWEKQNKEILQKQQTNQKAREYAYQFLNQHPDIQIEPSILQKAFLAGYNQAKKKYTIQNQQEK